MNKNNLKFRNYFIKINQVLEKYNNKLLYYIPNLYKQDLRVNKTPLKITNFLKSMFAQSYLYDNIDKIKKAKICFITHYIGNNIVDKDDDFYYGSLFKNFKLKIPFYVLLINHTDESLIDIKKKFKNSKINRVYLNSNFNLLAYFIVTFKITKEYLYFLVRNFINRKKITYLDNIKINFNYNFFLNSRFTLKISNQIIKILAKSTNLNYLMITFEGHAFEKIIFNYCKTQNIKSFGYFFSIMRQYKNFIYYNLAKDYQPDVVLTSGDTAKKYFKLNTHYKKIETLGCDRDLSKKKRFNILKNKRNRKLTILVCPEGIFSETIEMFNLINNKTLNDNNFQFIFRTHPVINIGNDLQKNLVNENIIFSKESDIKKDFQKSDIILYAGSSVCIQAAMLGVVPVNYRNKNSSFSLDPLHEVNNFVVYNNINLKLKINSIFRNRFNKKFNNQIFLIKKYSSSYFKKINQDVLTKYINVN